MTKSTTSSRGWPGAGARLFAALGLAGALATGGCDQFMQQPRCSELANCGGNVPLGSWVLTPGHGSCSEDIYVAPTDPRLVMGMIPPARTPPPEPALFDWCDNLITGQNPNIQSVPAIFYTDDIQVGAATIQYKQDGTYSAGITRTGRYELYFPTFCMRAFGAMNGKPAFDPNMNMTVGNPTDVCGQLTIPLSESGAGNGSFRNTNCVPSNDHNDPGGCSCTFDVVETGGGAGVYIVKDGNTIVNLPGNGLPQTMTYCNVGSELQLSGTDGQDLFGTLGLRTLDLVPMP